MKTYTVDRPKTNDFTTMKVKMTEIETLTWPEGLTICFRQLLRSGSEMVKLEISAHQITSQSFARAYIYDRDAKDWKGVYHIPPMIMETVCVPYDEKVAVSLFAADRKTLLEYLLKIVFRNATLDDEK
jgi:hypothetical protein